MYLLRSTCTTHSMSTILPTELPSNVVLLDVLDHVVVFHVMHCLASYVHVCDLVTLRFLKLVSLRYILALFILLSVHALSPTHQILFRLCSIPFPRKIVVHRI